MKKSIWSGKHSASLKEVTLPGMTRFGGRAPDVSQFVEPEHEAELRRFIDYSIRFGRLFLTLVMAASLLAVVGASLAPVWPWALWICLVATVAIGVTIIVFPFATPETVAWLGIRRSRTLARYGGIIVVGIAVWMAAFTP